jgi:hypothetical protein
MHDPSNDKEPHLIVGIEADNNYEEVMRDAGVVAGAALSENEYVDFTQVRPGEGSLSEYMTKNVKPFYERTWGSKLKLFLTSGRA